MKLFQRAGALLVSAATVLGLAACSGSDDNTAAVTETQNASSSAARSADAVHITDAAGRTLDFEARPERIVLAEGRAVYATATLQDNPFNNVVAYGDDLNKAAPALQERLLEDYPEAKDMPMIGSEGRRHR